MKDKVIIKELYPGLYEVSSITYPGISGIGYSIDGAKYDFKLRVCEILEINKTHADEIELEVV